jgi:hypothetical protein
VSGTSRVVDLSSWPSFSGYHCRRKSSTICIFSGDKLSSQKGCLREEKSRVRPAGIFQALHKTPDDTEGFHDAWSAVSHLDADAPLSYSRSLHLAADERF